MDAPASSRDVSSRRRRFFFTIVTLLLATTATLIFGDFFLYWWDARRVSGRPAPPIPWTRLSDPPINDDTPGGMRLKRFLDCEIVDPASGRVVKFRTNALGYRDRPVLPREPGEFRILVLGDSITLSAYTEEEETYVRQLEHLLAKSLTGIRTINAGMRGACLREYLLILTETGLLTQPDMVLVGLYLNDAKRSRTFPLPEGLAAYSAIARRLQELSLVNELSDESRERWERYAGKPFPTKSFPEEAWRTDREAFEALIAAAAVDWGFAWFPAAWEEMRPDMQLIRELTDKYGIRLAVALFPSTYQVEAMFLDTTPQEMFDKMMKEMKLPYLDLLPILRAAYRERGHSLAYDNCHLTPEGNAVVADALAEFLRPLIKEANSSAP